MNRQLFVVLSVATACGSGGGDVPFPDAGPPEVRFSLGAMYPAEPRWVLNGGIIPREFMASEPTWMIAKVIPPFDPAIGTVPELGVLTAVISIQTDPGGAVIAEMETPVEHVREDFSFDIGVAQIPFEMCGPDTGAGDRLRVTAVFSDESGAVFAMGDSGAQVVTDSGEGEFCP